MKMHRTLGLWAAVAITLAGCGDAATEATVADSPPSSATPASATGTSPPIDVAVEARDLGPLTVTVGQPTAAPQNEARTWVQHDLTITNPGPSTVHLNDIRQSAFLGDPHALLAGDSVGCGYGAPADEPVEPVCTASYSPLTLGAHEAHVIQVLLWKGLAGLVPLTPGRYTLDKPIRYRQDRPFNDPRETASSGTITLTYTVRSATEPSAGEDEERSSDAAADREQIGVGQPAQLSTHCGIERFVFDGVVWLADPPLSDGEGNPPDGWGNPYAAGTFTITAHNRAVFRSGDNEAHFRRAADPVSDARRCR
jgi:hypothetical protein